MTPDWVCEVLSPSTAALDRGRKLPLYGAAGVRHAWLVDPVARTLEAYERRGEVWVLLATLTGDERGRVRPFEAIELRLEDLWVPDGPPG